MSLESQDSSFTVLAGYDGSPSATAAIEYATRLLPGARAIIGHILGPPFCSPELRHRLWPLARSVDDMIALTEREGAAEAERLVNAGVLVARDGGWEAEGRVERSYAGDGVALARLAEVLAPRLVVVGARGLSGGRALIGSESDAVVHYSPVPVLVVPQHLLAVERDAASAGPVVVAFDGSRAAARALRVAAELFAGRALIAVTAGPPAAQDPISDVGAEYVVVAAEGTPHTARGVADAVAAVAAERGAAAIVVGSRGQSAGREILLGSTAMAMVHHGRRPVVVVPAEERFGAPHPGA